MKKFFSRPLSDTPDNLMRRAGYERHCVEAGRVCFHRKLAEHTFPRFHLYLSVREKGMEVDLHFDQYNFKRRGNHDKSWAYEGGRVNGELKRIVEAIKGIQKPRKVNQPHQSNTSVLKKKKIKRKQGLFDILFR